MIEAPEIASCSRPYHCSCGCGSHGPCFIYDEVPTGLELVYARVINSRLSLGHGGREGGSDG